MGHNIIRTNKEHKTLALKDFQEQDIEAVLQRPAFCQKKHHEKEELKIFCKNCQVAICNTCAVTLHERHNKMLLQEATDAHKLHINSLIESLKEKEQQKRKDVEQCSQDSMEVQMQMAEVKSQVAMSADQMIEIIEERKQHVFDAVDEHAQKSLESLLQKKDEVENQLGKIDSAIARTEALLKQSFSTDVLGFNETFDTILQDWAPKEIVPRLNVSRLIPRFSFNKPEKLINVLNSEGIGNVKTVVSTTKAQQSRTKGKESNKVIAGNNLANDCDSPFEVKLQTRRFRPVLLFGQKGKSVGMLNRPWGVAVNDSDEIAVTDCFNHRISVFRSNGTHLRSFGKKGKSNGEFQYPTGIAFDSLGNNVVAENSNHRVQVLDRNGNFLRKFGERGNLDHQLNYPQGLSVNGNGDIIVANSVNQLIKIFSSNGHYLGKFRGVGSLINPNHCIQHGQYFIVPDYGDHSSKMFDLGGKLISKFGREGSKDGEFNGAHYLSINKEGFLAVCDTFNHRIQVFELSRKFVTKFGREGSERGEFKHPNSTANLSDGKIVVCDKENNHIQVFDLIQSTPL